MFRSSQFVRPFMGVVVVLLLFGLVVPNTFGGQTASTDPDDLTALASFKRQRNTGTALAFGKTLTAAPKSPTATITRTPTKGSPTATRGTPTATAMSEATLAIRAYAQAVLGVVVDVTDSRAGASSYLGQLTTVPVANIGHTAALSSASKSYGASLSNGSAVLSYGTSAGLIGDLTADVQSVSYATYTLIVNASGVSDTPTPGTRIAPVFAATNTSTVEFSTPKFDPAGTLTALPTIPRFNPNATIAALPTVPQFNPGGTSTALARVVLTQGPAFDLVKSAFPLLARLEYQPLTVTNGFAWYAKSKVSVLNPRTKQLETLDQTAILYVVGGTGGKAAASATVARGSFVFLINVP